MFGLGEEHVARVHHVEVPRSDVECRAALLDELRDHRDRVPFALPHVERIERIGERLVTIEPRLPGRPLGHALRELSGAVRRRTLESTLEASRLLGEIPFERPWFGDLCRSEPVRAGRWGDYLRARARRSLASAGEEFRSVDVDALCRPFAEPVRPGLVHLDLYAGNVLVEAGRVTAILDFGGVPVFGDPAFDPVSVAVYLRGTMTDSARPEDHATCERWLAEHQLLDRLAPVERWLAALWSCAVDDPKLQAWCRSCLGLDAPKA